MKKSLIALAVAGTFAAPAFAATENVDVYGKLHLSVNLPSDQTTTGNGSNDLQLSSNASRFGIKGAEDLGGGLSAIWQFEQTLVMEESGDASKGELANRNSFIGLKGGFGTVLAGRHDTPLKSVGRAVDLFGDTMADSRNVMGGGSDTRVDNVIVYLTPEMGGFGVAAAYFTDDASAASNNGDAADDGAFNLNATYKNGPIYVGVGYGDGDHHENAGLGSHMRVAGGVTFGPAKIVAQYDSLEDDNALTGQAGDFAAFMVGGAFTMGNIVLKANYMEGEYDGDLGTAGYDATQFTVGADYKLSKRTTAYALYAAGEEGVVMGEGAGTSDKLNSCGTCGTDISVLSVGMIHTF
jgi:predicted porin